jgi:hypothetical protein
MIEHDEILISLKPKHAAHIFEGEKTVELRKRRPNIKPGTRIWIYATSPTAAIKGVRKSNANSDWFAFAHLEDLGQPDWDLERRVRRLLRSMRGGACTGAY